MVSAIDPSEGSFVAESSVQIGQIAALVDDFSIARAAFSIFISDIDESESQKIIENTFKCLR